MATAAKLKKITIGIPFRTIGPGQLYTGYQVAPGIGVVRIDGTWRVTHLPSKLRCAGAHEFATRREAVEMARVMIAMLPTVTWTDNNLLVAQAMRARRDTHFPELRMWEMLDLFRELAEKAPQQ